MILIATLNDTFFERSSLDTISIRVDHIAHWKGAFLEWDSFEGYTSEMTSYRSRPAPGNRLVSSLSTY